MKYIKIYFDRRDDKTSDSLEDLGDNPGGSLEIFFLKLDDLKEIEYSRFRKSVKFRFNDKIFYGIDILFEEFKFEEYLGSKSQVVFDIHISSAKLFYV
jgi:hypothetical protein